jgi:hypothetical protein
VRLIDRLPYSDETTYLPIVDGMVEIRRYQIVVWVSLRTRLFPAILDTGHSHNFTISEGQLGRLAGVDHLPIIGHAAVNRQLLPPAKGDVWLYGNRRGTREPTGRKILLRMDEGITIYPDEAAPRLPLLGLRAISRNDLRLIIDGKRREVTLKKGWP